MERAIKWCGHKTEQHMQIKKNEKDIPNPIMGSKDNQILLQV